MITIVVVVDNGRGIELLRCVVVDQFDRKFVRSIIRNYRGQGYIQFFDKTGMMGWIDTNGTAHPLTESWVAFEKRLNGSFHWKVTR